MEIKRVFDAVGNSWHVGKSYFGKDAKVRQIVDNSFWNNGELGFRGGAVNFAFDFDDNTRVVMYPEETVFVEMEPDVLGL